MNAETEQIPVARMELPPSGGVGCALFMALFVGFFVALAVFNLATYPDQPAFGIVAAVLWLLFVGVQLWLARQIAGGVRAAAIAWLGRFSSRQFVEVQAESARPAIAFGYELFRRRFYYLFIEREHIVSVDVSSGQATAFAGKDMNDWSVVLWYRDPIAPPQRHIEGARTDEEYFVGPSRAKATTEEFLRSFVAFLRAAGVALHPTDKQNEFRRTDP
jgi:hypothetical protein